MALTARTEGGQSGPKLAGGRLRRCDSGLDGGEEEEEEGRDQPCGLGPEPERSGGEERCESACDSAYGSGPLDSFGSRCSLGSSAKAPAQETAFNPWAYLSKEGDTFLHLCIIHQAESLALTFIGQSSPEYLNWQNDLYQTPLHLAMYTRQASIVRHLVVLGADAELQDRNGNTPLHLACLYGLEESARALTRPLSAQERRGLGGREPADTPRNLERHNWQGLTCLHLAVLSQNDRMVEHILYSGARVNTQEATSGRTALHLAVELGDLGLVSRLLRAGGDPDAPMYNGCTPLHLAAGRMDPGIASALCQAGADPLLPNMEEDTPMDLANSNWNILDLCPFDDVRLRGQPVAV